MPAHEPIRILLVDDQPLFRGAIASLIDGRDDMVVVGEAENGLDAVEKARLLVPDLVVMDVEMPVMDGVEAVRLIREQLSTVKVIMLTVSEADDHVFDAIRFGAPRIPPERPSTRAALRHDPVRHAQRDTHLAGHRRAVAERDPERCHEAELVAGNP